MIQRVGTRSWPVWVTLRLYWGHKLAQKAIFWWKIIKSRFERYMIHKYCVLLVKFLLSEMLLLHLRATHKTTVQGGNHGLWLSCYMAPKTIFSWKMVQNCDARGIYLIDMTLFVAAYLRSITTENEAIKLIQKCPTNSRTQWFNNSSKAAALKGC